MQKHPFFQYKHFVGNTVRTAVQKRLYAHRVPVYGRRRKFAAKIRKHGLNRLQTERVFGTAQGIGKGRGIFVPAKRAAHEVQYFVYQRKRVQLPRHNELSCGQKTFRLIVDCFRENPYILYIRGMRFAARQKKAGVQIADIPHGI